MAETIADFFRGDTKTYGMTFTDKDGQPIPLFGRSIWMTFKLLETDDDASAILQAKVTPPDDADSALGKAWITLTSEDTAVEPNTYFYDIQLVTPDLPGPPIVKTLVKGKLKISQDITTTNS